MKNRKILIILFFGGVLFPFLYGSAWAGNGIPSLPTLVSVLLFAGLGACIGFLFGIWVGKHIAYRRIIDSDNVSGIPESVFFARALRLEWNRNLRNAQPLSIIIGEIDDLKALQNAYGHERTKHCLKDIATIFEKNLQRAGDFVAKKAKSQFIAVLPDTLATEAGFLAEKIREGVESLAMVHCHSTTGKILTLSLGTATMVPRAENHPENLLSLAEKAILQAVNSGGNRVVSMDEEES